MEVARGACWRSLQVSCCVAVAALYYRLLEMRTGVGREGSPLGEGMGLEMQKCSVVEMPLYYRDAAVAGIQARETLPCKGFLW